MADKTSQRSLLGTRVVTVGGLVACALGIGILWVSGAEFPIAIPPGSTAENTTASSRSEIVFLTIGAIVIAVTRWRWTPAVGAALGLLFTLGFLLDSSGAGNLVGEGGASATIGQWVQLAGELTAVIAGVAATMTNYREPERTRRTRQSA